MGATFDPVLVRRVLLFAVFGACASAPTTSSTTEELVGAPSGTPTFPNTQVGQTSAAQTYYIYETTETLGVHTDTISSIAYSCPDFTVNWAAGTTGDDCIENTCGSGSNPLPSASGSLPPICPLLGTIECTYSPVYSFSATFHPTVAASVSCVLTITSTSGTQTYTLSGTGTAPPIDVTATPASIAFGTVPVSTNSTAVTVTVTNSGSGAATVSSVGVPTGYAITSGTTTSYSLAAGASEAYSVVCQPSAVGALGGAMTISSNDPAHPTISIPLSCTGIDSTLTASPSPAVIPTTRVGEPVQQTITLTNIGGAATTIQDVVITGVDTVSAPGSNTPLGANASTQVVVSFPATTAGSASGNLHVDYNSGKSIDVSISADALATSMSLTPDGMVDFGPVCAGATKMQTFTLIANEAGAFQLTGLSMPVAPFTLTAPTLPASVAGNAGNTVTFDVTAAPVASGDATSSITVTTDIPSSQPDMISLDVSGLPTGVSGTPSTVDLGPAPVATTTLAQPVDVTNCSASSITITSSEITGPDAAAFAIVTDPSNTTLAPSATATWLVVMNSPQPGMLQATFEADYSGGSATVTLVGEPFTPGDGSGTGGSGPEKSSYYACASGEPAALWPLAVALLALRRRRTR